ncbi:glutamate--cysteine ligase [Mycobacterium tuberculosis]|jgi:Glutamate-cysteine ligase|uniref:Uncharacterized protein n=1 Tax=Ralstonia pickettii TaxID=329 RepID=A0ABN9HZT8_RALPI|nr:MULTISPECIES: glutamate--cysteine ligase [Ralstonia]MBP0532711.1 glutamate--cysteine ligase [Mycobacterium tuberculosis]CAJ0722701.1 hypothetical protein R38712_01240 [Ralstonia pickettii]
MIPHLFTAFSSPLSAVTKDSQPLSRVIIQEGVPSRERLHGAVAEPVVYMIGQHVVGGFYRANPARAWTSI